MQLNTDEASDQARAYAVAWTPTLVVEHHRGARLRSWMGYLTPAEFFAEIKLAHALHALRSAQPGLAQQRLRALREEHGGAFVAAEAIYWEGIAAYAERRDKEPLWTIWRELVRLFPTSPWAMKTTLLEEDGPTHRAR